jgi:predicted transcriptional regulator
VRDEVVFKLTDKGRNFILEFSKVEKFAEAFGIAI